MNSDKKLFDGYMFVYLGLNEVTILPSVHLVALAENNLQHNQ